MVYELRAQLVILFKPFHMGTTLFGTVSHFESGESKCENMCQYSGTVYFVLFVNTFFVIYFSCTAYVFFYGWLYN